MRRPLELRDSTTTTRSSPRTVTEGIRHNKFIVLLNCERGFKLERGALRLVS
jgi:hypothetical protein